MRCSDSAHREISASSNAEFVFISVHLIVNLWQSSPLPSLRHSGSVRVLHFRSDRHGLRVGTVPRGIEIFPVIRAAAVLGMDCLEDVAGRPADESAGGGERLKTLPRLDTPRSPAPSLSEVGVLRAACKSPKMFANALCVSRYALLAFRMPKLILQNLLFVQAGVAILGPS